jgi:sigma-B regulation protein RsbU (phosphoserine phosphatase)
VRLEKELRFDQRVQAALLPTDLPKRLKGVDVVARFTQAHGLGGGLHDFLAPEPNGLLVAIGDVSGTGVRAALYSALVGELGGRSRFADASGLNGRVPRPSSHR